MNGQIDDLPLGIRANVLRYLHEEDGEFRVVDVKGLLNFIIENSVHYPALLSLVQLDENALIERFQQTGELPPGVKLVRKTTQEGSKVTKLDIFHGPRSREP